MTKSALFACPTIQKKIRKKCILNAFPYISVVIFGSTTKVLYILL